MARYKLPSCLFLDQSGNVVEDGTCSVFLAGTTTVASIYAASAGGVAVNSVTADDAGQCTWYVDTSDYGTSQKFDITMSMTNFTPQTYEDIVVFPEVTLTGTETLTNKTLTSPTITSPTITGGSYTSPVLTTPQINDTSSDHQYVTAVNELTADRTVTLPLLTGNDEYTFNAHTQTLTNKTLTTPVIASAYQDAGKTKLMTLPNTASDTLTAIAATQTLTNKTLTTPVVASLYQDAGKTKLMTVPNTASDTLTANDATQTLTNKTLTSPVIDGTAVGVVSVIDSDVTATEVVNTVTETTVYSYSVPANTLSTNRMLRMTLVGDYLNNSGTDKTLQIRVKYGSTTIGDFTSAVLSTNATRRDILASFDLISFNSTSAQLGVGKYEIGASNVSGVSSVNATSPEEVSYHNTIAEDSTGALNLVVTFENSAAAATVSATAKTIHLEYVS